MTITKKKKTQTKTKTKKSLTKSKHVFVPTEGEDILEANISFLISLMGGSLYDDYVSLIVVPMSGQMIDVTQVNRPTDIKNIQHIIHPTIFYGYKNTHFTCSYDKKTLWNSYKEGIQLGATDHFCQTFALMRMESYFLPDSFLGEEFQKLRRGEFLFNAWIAKNVACYVIETMMKFYPNSSRINELVDDQLEGHALQHTFTNKQIVTKLLAYCKPLTIEDFQTSTFREKVLLS
jgi:hypothetical protein